MMGERVSRCAIPSFLFPGSVAKDTPLLFDLHLVQRHPASLPYSHRFPFIRLSCQASLALRAQLAPDTHLSSYCQLSFPLTFASCLC